MLHVLPSIEDGHVVLRLGGELDGEGAAAVARLIGQSMGDFSIDFTDVKHVEQSGFAVLAQAIRRCCWLDTMGRPNQSLRPRRRLGWLRPPPLPKPQSNCAVAIYFSSIPTVCTARAKGTIVESRLRK